MSGRRVAAQCRLELRLLLRNGENLLVALGIPVGLLVFFTLVPVLPLRDDLPAVRFLVPGVLTVSVMGSAMVSLGIATAFERSYLVLKRLGATPLRRGELVAAKLLAVLAIVAVQLAAVLVAGLALGWEPPPRGSTALVAAVILLVLGVAAFAGVGLGLAGSLPSLTNLAVVNSLFVVLLLVSGLVFPLDVLPSGLAAAARLLPSAALGEALRGVLAGPGVFGSSAGAATTSAYLVLAVWAFAAPLLAAKAFRWE